MIQTAKAKERVLTVRFEKKQPLETHRPKSPEFIPDLKLGPCDRTELPSTSLQQTDQSTTDSSPNLSPRCEEPPNLSPEEPMTNFSTGDESSELKVPEPAANYEISKTNFNTKKRNGDIKKLEIEKRQLEKQAAHYKWLLEKMTKISEPASDDYDDEIEKIDNNPKRNRDINRTTYLGMEKEKLAKQADHYKWLLGTMTKDFDVFKKKAKWEKCRLQEEVDRLKRQLKRTDDLSLEVKKSTDPDSEDMIYARPRGSSTRFKPYLHIPRATTESPSRRIVQYRTSILRKCLDSVCGDQSFDEKIRQIVSFLKSDKNILERVKQELGATSPECPEFRLTPSETYNFMKSFNLTMYQMKFMKRYFLKAKGLLLFCSDSKLRNEATGQTAKDESNSDE